MSILVWIAAYLAAVYAILALTVALLQRKLIYRPDERRTTPEASGFAGVEEWALETPDDCTLIAWYAPAEPGCKTVLYFHGNAGWIELRNERLAELKSRGFGVLMPSLRGYGGSTGTPSETAAIADAKLCYGALLARGLRPAEIVIFGESLGTGIATALAAERPAAGLVLDSPYTSMTEIAARRYPWLPVSWLLFDRYETLARIPLIAMPLLVIHGGGDRLVPAEMGQRVHNAASHPKALAIFPRVAHLAHLSCGSFNLVAAWIDGLGDREPSETKPSPAAGGRKRDRLGGALVHPAPSVASPGGPRLTRRPKENRPEAVPQAYVVGKV